MQACHLNNSSKRDNLLPNLIMTMLRSRTLRIIDQFTYQVTASHRYYYQNQMGQSDSRQVFPFGDISIELNKDQIIAGQPLHGIIALRLTNQFNTDRLQMEFSGKQRVYFDQHELRADSGFGETQAKCILFEKKQVLQAYSNRQVLPGLYHFPFHFDTPPTLPSSFVYAGSHRSFLRVRYKIKVGMEDLSGVYKPLYKKRLVQIGQAPPMINFNMLHCAQNEIKTLMFVERGHCIAECSFEKDAYQQNEVIACNIKINNQHCKESVSKVELKLKREIAAYTVPNALDGRMLNQSETIAKTFYPGVGAWSSVERQMQINMTQLKLDPSRLEPFLKYDQKIFPEERNVIHSNVLMPSIRSAGQGIIECRYFLEVVVDHGVTATGNKMPKIKQEIFLYPEFLPRHMTQGRVHEIGVVHAIPEHPIGPPPHTTEIRTPTVQIVTSNSTQYMPAPGSRYVDQPSYGQGSQQNFGGEQSYPHIAPQSQTQFVTPQSQPQYQAPQSYPTGYQNQ